jgi:hypothetical protein
LITNEPTLRKNKDALCPQNERSEHQYRGLPGPRREHNNGRLFVQREMSAYGVKRSDLTLSKTIPPIHGNGVSNIVMILNEVRHNLWQISSAPLTKMYGKPDAQVNKSTCVDTTTDPTLPFVGDIH